MYTLEGVSSVANFIIAYEGRVSIKPRLPFLIRCVFFVSKGNRFDVYLTTLQLELVPVLYVHEQEGHSDATLGAKKRKRTPLLCYKNKCSIPKKNMDMERHFNTRVQGSTELIEKFATYFKTYQ